VLERDPTVARNASVARHRWSAASAAPTLSPSGACLMVVPPCAGRGLDAASATVSLASLREAPVARLNRFMASVVSPL